MDQVHAMQKAVKRHAAAPTRAGRAAKQNLIRTGEKAYELLPARVSNPSPRAHAAASYLSTSMSWQMNME